MIRRLIERVTGKAERAKLAGDVELLRNAVEQANLLLERSRFEEDTEGRVVRAVLRSALRTTAR